MVNPTASKANSTQRLIQRLPATFCSANNAKTHKTLNSLSSSALWSLITTQIAKKKTCKPDFLSQQKVPKASSATTKASKEKNLHNTEPKKCLFHGCNNKQGNAFRNKVLDRRPSALQRSKQQQKCFPQFFYPTQQPTKHSTRQG